MKPYSMDLRQRVLAGYDAGLTTAQVAARFTVSPAWARRLKQRRRQSGEVAPRAARRGPRPSWHAYADRLRQAVRDAPDATLAELRQRLGLTVALSTLWRAVAALGLSLKKKSAGPPSRTAPTSPPAASAGGPSSRAWTPPG
jgi:transposase